MSATAFQRMRREREEEKNNETVAEVKVKIEDMSIDELKAYATDHSIDIGKAATVEGILKKIKGCEANE